MPARRVVILGAARTPIGRYGGSFKDVHPAELGAVASRAAITRAGIEAADIGELLFGHGRQAGSGPNPARQVGHRAGIPHEAPAQTINKACASGLQALASGAQSILLGESDVVLVGGIESMSRMPYLVDAADARWGHKMGHFQLVDAMYRDGFSCPLSNLIMGETAEVLARQYGITRDQSDAFALDSQQKTEAAQKAGRFTDEIAPVTLETKPGRISSGSSGKHDPVSSDEHPRHGSTMDALKKLPLVFPSVEGHEGIITAGSSSGITDGGAALVLASDQWAADRNLKPLATITGWATAGVDPRIMGIGPVPAIRRLEERSGLTIDDFDLVEINEAFAPQVLAVLRDVPIPLEKVNVNGGAIALGHPIGCTGARMVVTLLYELLRRGGGCGLATLCVSGGMGMALAIETV
ncbi:MAG: acetyl-CoA C-acyltransferase [Vicinamibacterales bacterium]